MKKRQSNVKKISTTVSLDGAPPVMGFSLDCFTMVEFQGICTEFRGIPAQLLVRVFFWYFLFHDRLTPVYGVLVVQTAAALGH